MEIDAVSSITQGRASESPADVWASKLAQKMDEMRRANSSPATSLNVATSPNYTPAVMAQAASFQMYNQAGTAAAMVHGTGAQPHPSSVEGEPDDIHAVEGAQGASVNTVA